MVKRCLKKEKSPAFDIPSQQIRSIETSVRNNIQQSLAVFTAEKAA